MKLAARDAASHFANPSPASAATLIYGADPMRVALKRQDLVAALVGPMGEEEMRFNRIGAADLRKDPALLTDSLKAQGFFPGPRAVLMEDAGDGVTDAVKAALADWREGDAHLVVTAGTALPPRSSLRKMFETLKNGFAVAIYDNPPTRQELEAALEKAGLTKIDRDAMSDLVALSQALDPGDFRQTLEKLALYSYGQSGAVTSDDVAACAPATIEAGIDDLLHVVAEARTGEIGPLMQRLFGQGTAPVQILIFATRHFRTLYSASCDPGGPGAGIGRARPPIFGPRRDRMLRQAQSWVVPKLAQALQMLTETDLQLRSAGQRAPDMALVERLMIRLARLRDARR